jgi:hypothetical protein
MGGKTDWAIFSNSMIEISGFMGFPLFVSSFLSILPFYPVLWHLNLYSSLLKRLSSQGASIIYSRKG